MALAALCVVTGQIEEVLLGERRPAVRRRRRQHAEHLVADLHGDGHQGTHIRGQAARAVRAGHQERDAVRVDVHDELAQGTGLPDARVGRRR